MSDAKQAPPNVLQLIPTPFGAGKTADGSYVPNPLTPAPAAPTQAVTVKVK